MRILFDQGVPVPLRKHLSEYAMDTAFERGWSTLDNGALVNSAEADGYRILITTDQNLWPQQNRAERRLAIVVQLATLRRRIQGRVEDIRGAADRVALEKYIRARI